MEIEFKEDFVVEPGEVFIDLRLLTPAELATFNSFEIQIALVALFFFFYVLTVAFHLYFYRR